MGNKRHRDIISPSSSTAAKPSKALPQPAIVPPKRLPGAAYWRRINPKLHVEDAQYLQECATVGSLSVAEVATLKARLINDGFFTLEDLPWYPSLRAMREGVRRLQRRGWPATLLLVYDEAWVMAHQISALLAAVSGGCANSLDTLAWSVTPSLGQAGFAPHRDRQPADVPNSFRADGTPKYTTCWVALSEASVENSCLYLVPRGHDAGYDVGDDHSADAEDPLITTLRSDAAVQAVRACPLRPGGCVIFSHRAMHWGSSGRPDCDKARISISFGHSDASFERPYFARPDRELPYPKTGMRLALASAQLIAYHERFEFGLPMLRRFGATFKARKRRFTSEYAEKIAAEFMAALHDRQADVAATLAQKKTEKRQGKRAWTEALAPVALAAEDSNEEGDEDEEEADAALDDALDAMLDAQAAAEGNLYDDYDGLDDE